MTNIDEIIKFVRIGHGAVAGHVAEALAEEVERLRAIETRARELLRGESDRFEDIGADGDEILLWVLTGKG